MGHKKHLNADGYQNHDAVMALFWRFGVTFVAGFACYYASTFGVYGWFTLCSVIPAILFITHHVAFKIFNQEFDDSNLRRVKYVTFTIQNAVLFYYYLYGTDDDMGFLVTWIYRINVFEVLCDLLVHKCYWYILPSAVLLYKWNVVAVKDPQFIFLWTNWDWEFVLEYNLWFIGWINHRAPEHFNAIAHCLFPLFLPPIYWFSCRTFTGMFMLVFCYFKPTAFVLDMHEFKPEMHAFRDIYDGLYITVWTAFHISKLAIFQR